MGRSGWVRLVALLAAGGSGACARRAAEGGADAGPPPTGETHVRVDGGTPDKGGPISDGGAADADSPDGGALACTLSDDRPPLRTCANPGPPQGADEICVGAWCHLGLLPALGEIEQLVVRAPDDVWVATRDGLIHGDGQSWAIVPGSSGMSRFAVLDNGAVWAVIDGHVARFDGGAWTTMFTPSTPGREIALSAATNGDVWIEYGDTGALSVLSHWDGAAWTERLRTTEAYLADFWRSPSGVVWVVGNASTARCDRASCALTENPDGAILQAVWGAADDDIWAVAVTGHVLHYDGSTWRIIRGRGGPVWTSVWGSGSDDVWIVGYDGPSLHWDGKALSEVSCLSRPQPVGGPAGPVYTAVAGSRRGDVWIGGDGVLLHGDGASFADATRGPRGSFAAVWSGSPADIWLVGDAGRAVRWNGCDWEATDTSTTAALSDVWGASPNDIWAVGLGDRATPGPTLIHWDGAAWSPWALPVAGRAATTKLLGRAADDIWIGSDQATVAHWDGTAWTAVTDGPFAPAMPGVGAIVAGSGPGDVYRAFSKSFQHWDGAAWQTLWSTSETNESISGVWGASDDVYVGVWQPVLGSLMEWRDGQQVDPQLTVRTLRSPITDVAVGPTEVWVLSGQMLLRRPR